MLIIVKQILILFLCCKHDELGISYSAQTVTQGYDCVIFGDLAPFRLYVQGIRIGSRYSIQHDPVDYLFSTGCVYLSTSL